LNNFVLLLVETDSIHPQHVSAILTTNGCRVESLSHHHLKGLLSGDTPVKSEIVCATNHLAKQYTPVSSEPQGNELLAQNLSIFLLANLAENNGLDYLSRKMNTNRNKLSRMFKAKFGVSIFAWLRQKRMAKAANLLIGTDKTIEAVAYVVGYGDPNNFSTCFKRCFGRSPLNYRKNVSGKEMDDAIKDKAVNSHLHFLKF
jgi:AraC-like DNA-binding protein